MFNALTVAGAVPECPQRGVTGFPFQPMGASRRVT